MTLAPGAGHGGRSGGHDDAPHRLPDVLRGLPPWLRPGQGDRHAGGAVRRAHGGRARCRAGWRREYEAMGLPFPPAGERVTHLAEFTAMLKDFLAGRAGRPPTATTSGCTTWARCPCWRALRRSWSAEARPACCGFAGAEADIVSINFNNRSGVIGADSVATSGSRGDRAEARLGARGRRARTTTSSWSSAAYFLALDGGATSAADADRGDGTARRGAAARSRTRWWARSTPSATSWSGAARCTASAT